MRKQLHQITVVLVFVVALFSGMLMNVVSSDVEYSEEERRRLKRFPAPSVEDLLDGGYFESLEMYSLDQFPFRETFRTINAMTRLNLFRQADVNGLYIVDDGVYRLRYPLDESSVHHAGELFHTIYEEHFAGHDVFFSVVPDKNYFVAPQNNYPHMDYASLVGILRESLGAFEYVDIFEKLEIGDYYRTDHHWRQERVVGVADFMLESMRGSAPNRDAYEMHTHAPFRGSYYGHASMPLRPDTLTYLTNDTIERSYAFDPVNEEARDIYHKDALEGVDPYNVFLGGAQPFLELVDPEASNDEELIVFGDSYANSLVPLLLEGYSRVTLVDLRHVSPDLLDQYIDISTQDVLFMYSTSILNDSRVLD